MEPKKLQESTNAKNKQATRRNAIGSTDNYSKNLTNQQKFAATTFMSAECTSQIIKSVTGFQFATDRTIITMNTQ